MRRLISLDRVCCQDKKIIISVLHHKREYLTKCMFSQTRFVVNARVRDRWKDVQTRDDSSVCWWETPPLTSTSSVMNSSLFWEAILFFFFLPKTFSLLIQIFDLIYFIHSPEETFLSTVCSQVEPFRAMLLEQTAVELLKVVLAGIDVLGLKPLTPQNETGNHWSTWSFHVGKIKNFL